MTRAREVSDRGMWIRQLTHLQNAWVQFLPSGSSLILSREEQGSRKRPSPGVCLGQEQASGGLGPWRAGVTPGHLGSAAEKSFSVVFH